MSMAVFIDTGIFVALHNADDEFHLRSKELMKQALKSDLGRIFTSDYIIDEARIVRHLDTAWLTSVRRLRKSGRCTLPINPSI